MCRGLAIGFNYKKGVICKGVAEHSKTFRNEDNFCKLEIIRHLSNEKGYIITADEQYTKDDFNQFKEVFNKDGSIKKPVIDYIENWIKDNEVFFWKSLCNCLTYIQGERYIDQSSHENTGYIDQYNHKNKSYIDQSSHKNEGCIDQSYHKNEGYIKQQGHKNEGAINQSCHENKGSIIQSGHENEGYIDQSYHKNEGCIEQSSHENKGYIKQHGHRNKGNISQHSHRNKGRIFQTGHRNKGSIFQTGHKNEGKIFQNFHKNTGNIYQHSHNISEYTLYNHRCKAKQMTVQYMECGTKKENEFIKMLSDKAKHNVLYWSDVVKLAMKGFEK